MISRYWINRIINNFKRNSFLNFKNWSSKLLEIIKEFKLKGYKCYYLPRFTHMAFSTIEICFIRND